MGVSDPGSFRDPASRVLIDEDRVIRRLTERGLASWEALQRTDFFTSAVADGRVIATAEAPDAAGDAAGALQHPRLPMITYPYEWTFAMLRDAALLQLDLLRDALAEGITVKDATPFNIQFDHGRPVFIDVGSFEPYDPGDAWIGYRQFSRQFLYPLLMHAWVGIPHQPWVRGDVEGPTPADMRALLPPWRRAHPKALLHVELQARMEKKMADRAVRQDLKTAGFSKAMILRNVAGLRSLVESLEVERDDGEWTDYHQCDHVGRDRAVKTTFLEGSLDRWAPRRVLDLGANDGHFTEVAVAAGAHGIAVDGNEAVLEALYRRAVGKDLSVVLTDLANPSPAQGWAGVERASLADRARPDMVIAYGLIHHLIYAAGIPPRGVVEWLASFRCPVVLEYVSPDDEMAKRLIGNRLAHELHPGRGPEEFAAVLADSFSIDAREPLASGERVLYRLGVR